jgi:hypothetical protein
MNNVFAAPKFYSFASFSKSLLENHLKNEDEITLLSKTRGCISRSELPIPIIVAI